MRSISGWWWELIDASRDTWPALDAPAFLRSSDWQNSFPAVVPAHAGIQRLCAEEHFLLALLLGQLAKNHFFGA